MSHLKKTSILKLILPIFCILITLIATTLQVTATAPNYFQVSDRFNLNDDEIKKLAGIINCEVGSTLLASRIEASQIVNRYTNYGVSKTLDNAILSDSSIIGFYACHPNHSPSHYKGNYSDENIQAVKEVFLNGYRFLPRYVDEQGSYGMEGYLNKNGKTGLYATVDCGGGNKEYFGTTSGRTDLIDKYKGDNQYFDYDGVGGEITTTPSSLFLTISGDDITWIGDSYSEGAKSKISDAFPGVDIYAECGKHFITDANGPSTCKGGEGGLTILKNLKSSNKLRSILVFALGTNDSDLSESDIQKVVDEAGSNTQIILVTPYTKISTYDVTRKNFATIASKNSNVEIADWASLASSHISEYFAKDSEHPTGHYSEWVNIIKTTLDSLLPSSSPSSTVGILDEATLNFFNVNNIFYYNPANSICGTSESANLLAGDSFEEKVWNFFVKADISGVSDNPAAIAGIMGNLKTESKYDPFVHNGTYGGIFATKLEVMKKTVEKAGIKNAPWKKSGGSFWGDPDSYEDKDIVEQAIVAELNYLISEYQGFTDFTEHISAPTTQTGEQGAASYAELFLVYVERAVSSNACVKNTENISHAKLEDQGVQQAANNYYKGNSLCQNVPYQGADARRNYAKEIYNKYANSSSTSTSSSTSSASNSTQVSSSFSSLHKPSNNGWLSESDISGYSKSAHRYEDGNTIGLSCSRFDDNIATGFTPTKFATETELPQMIILHYMGSDMDVDSYDYCKSELGNISVAPHFSIYPKEKKVVQHIPLTQPSGSVEEGEGYWDRWAIQIEIDGDESQIQNYTDEEWSYVADLMVAITKQTGIPLTSTVDWNDRNTKLTTEAMKAYIGVLGHQHIQGNNHSDPGPIWDKLKAQINTKDYSIGCDDSSSGVSYCAKDEKCTDDGFTMYSQSDSRWTSWKGNSAAAGCGPTAFATAATNLLHQKITPQDVEEYLCDDLKVSYCGEASDWSIAETLAKHYNLEYKRLDSDFQAAKTNSEKISLIEKYLKSGWLIHVVGAGGEPFAFNRTTSGHYIVIRGIGSSSGTWKVINNTWSQNNNDFSAQDIINGIIANDSGGITALRSTNSGTCIIQCQTTTTSSSLTIDGFQDEELAEKVLMEPFEALYKDGEFIQSTMAPLGIIDTESCAAGPPYNCVSFSLYFLNKFTTLSNDTITGLGNGNAVAEELAKKFNLTIDSTPEVYSIFSWSNGGYGHTGVVVGVIDDNTILIAESSCQSGGNKQTAIDLTGVHKYTKKAEGQWSGVMTSSATDWKFTHIPSNKINIQGN